MIMAKGCLSRSPGAGPAPPDGPLGFALNTANRKTGRLS
jgi:hypothetical protein